MGVVVQGPTSTPPGASPEAGQPAGEATRQGDEAGTASVLLAERMRIRILQDRRAGALARTVTSLRATARLTIDDAARRAGVRPTEWELIELAVPEALDLLDVAAAGVGVDDTELERRVEEASRPTVDEATAAQRQLLAACEYLETMRAVRDHGMEVDGAMLDRTIDLVLEASLVLGSFALGDQAAPR